MSFTKYSMRSSPRSTSSDTSAIVTAILEGEVSTSEPER